MCSNNNTLNDSTVRPYAENPISETSEENPINESPNINISAEPEDTSYNLSMNETINQTADTLKTINSIKEELGKLPLDKCENQYITNNVFPITNILYLISTASVNLSNSVNVLTTSPIVHAKKSELKDTIDLIYDINEDCEDLYKVIHKRLKVLFND